MRPQATLRDLQQDLQRHLLGGSSGVIAGIVDAPPLPAAKRLAIYRNAYQVRLIDALHETYPVLHGLLGDEMFFALGESFVAEHPSIHRSIRWYGRELPHYLGRSAPYDEQPALSEVAMLEWTLAEVFGAPDAPSLTRAVLSQIDPSRWSELSFDFHPSLRRLEFHWNTAPIWKAMSRDETPPIPERGDPVDWLLWRQDLQNYFRSMSRAESTAIESARNGRNFSEICEDLGAVLPAEEIPPAAATFLGAWADSGIIIAIR
jgi:Putative DNA-binding domain